jgi:hypothetical protein
MVEVTMNLAGKKRDGRLTVPKERTAPRYSKQFFGANEGRDRNGQAERVDRILIVFIEATMMVVVQEVAPSLTDDA